MWSCMTHRLTLTITLTKIGCRPSDGCGFAYYLSLTYMYVLLYNIYDRCWCPHAARPPATSGLFIIANLMGITNLRPHDFREIVQAR